MARSLTQERLRELLTYDPNGGTFRWRIDRINGCGRVRMKAGDVAGFIRKGKDNYRVITIDYKPYLAHRLAWLYMTGEWPKQVDHKDCDKSNNAWSNLRLANTVENMANTKKYQTNSTGFKGVMRWKRSGKYYAQIRLRDRNVYLGQYDTAEEAHAAYVRAAQAHHGDFARAG